ncbi:MAG: chromosomal replication initiation ATPase DnaA [Rickettsiales bacterium]
MQLSFNFPTQERYLSADFLKSDCNKSAFDFVVNFDPKNQSFPEIFAIKAPKFAGKSHLANIWGKKHKAEFLDLKDLENTNLIKIIKAKSFYIIENIDEIKNQELLLQVFNLAQEKSSYLMMTSKSDLFSLGYAINDLNSRLKNVFQLNIEKPDDDLIKMLLIKNFSTKQLQVDNKVIDFLAKNLKRDFATVFDVVRLLEFYSLERKRNITIPLIKEVIKI